MNSMMRTVWKFPLKTLGDWNEVLVAGVETQVVLVGQDPTTGMPCVWIEHEPGGEPMRRAFIAVGTGHAIPSGDDIDPVEHVGSVIAGAFVWHIYERTFYYGG